MSMMSNHQPSLSQQQQLFHPEARAALSPAGALQQPPAEDPDDDRPVLIPCSTANVGIKLHRWVGRQNRVTRCTGCLTVGGCRMLSMLQTTRCLSAPHAACTAHGGCAIFHRSTCTQALPGLRAGGAEHVCQLRVEMQWTGKTRVTKTTFLACRLCLRGTLTGMLCSHSISVLHASTSIPSRS